MNLSSIDNGHRGKGLLFVISSISGGGKSTVIRNLLGVIKDLGMSVSHTTRTPRKGEVDGRDYHFVSEERFRSMVENGLFLEWAQVYGCYYGTSRRSVEAITEKGMDAVLDIDVQGAMQVKERFGGAVLIFLSPPSGEEQERRLRSRGTDEDSEIRKRLAAAGEELAFRDEYHYSVLNDDISDAIDTVKSIIRAERCRNRMDTQTTTGRN